MSPEQPLCKTEAKPALKSISIISVMFYPKYIKVVIIAISLPWSRVISIDLVQECFMWQRIALSLERWSRLHMYVLNFLTADFTPTLKVKLKTVWEVSD